MEKIAIDQIVNLDELCLIHDLECPIDSMISLNAVMCKKCETVFCNDCIETWRQKSNVCPMRCNPMENILIDRTVLKQQLNKIRLACKYQRYGCTYQVPIHEVSRHEKNCEYKPSKCDKCHEMVPNISLTSHLYESCEKNKATCFICEIALNLKDLITHLEDCRINSILCDKCTANISKEGDSHSLSCPLMILNCSKCSFPDLFCEINNENHRCITENQLKENNFSSYMKSVHSKYESIINTIKSKHEESYRVFNKSLFEISGDIVKRENDKNLIVETKFLKLYDDYFKRTKVISRDKNEQLNKNKNELMALNNLIENKEQEINNINIMFERRKSLLIKEYELKIFSKKENLNYLRKLLIQSTLTRNNHDNTDNDSQNSTQNLSVSTIQRMIICKFCDTELADTNANRCGNCSSTICKSCSIQCQNKSFEHPNNICKDCLIQCSLCLGNSQCKLCTKKCFYKNCNNLLCYKCYDRNKHQLRPENTNCKFYKCDSCLTDANCILSTVYCARCDRRVCKNCFHQDHQSHISIR